MKQNLIILLIGVFMVSCANPGIVKLSPDTYMLTKQDHGGIFGNAATLKADVIREANAFAESLGKVAIPISSNEIPLAPGRFANFEYQFRVVDPNDPEAQRTSLVPRPDVVIEKTEKSSVDIRSEETEKVDVYTELLKLDDLRKKGIITNQEFEDQKAKLLNSNR